MTSKDRVNAVFANKSYDRLPLWYGGAPETTTQICDYLKVSSEEEAMRTLGIDFVTLRPQYTGKPLRNGDTIWGIQRDGVHYGQALNHPLSHAEEIRDIENHTWPDENDWDVYITGEEQHLCRDYCVIGGMWSPFFHDVTELMGMEKCYIDMCFNPKLVEALIERVFLFYYNITERTFQANPGCVDLFFFGNDFGSQRGLLCSPEMWRRFFKPYLKQLVDLGHRYGAKTALHSCGDIHEIIPDLIDIGLDALNPIQVNADNMDPAVLKKEYGRDLVFWGAIDENIILSTGREQDVRRETRRMIDLLGADGRYIVAASHDYLLPEVPAANICAMYDEAKQYSKVL